MKNTLTFLGHGSLKVKTAEGTVIYIDPAFPCDGYQEAADLILITHHHSDHDRADLVTKKVDCQVLDNVVMLVDGIYQEKEIKGIKIQAVEAYNQNHLRDKCVGYLLMFNGLKLYFGGDTSRTEEMTRLADTGIDYVILPIDGQYNMGPAEAEACAKLIGARKFIPIHNDGRSFKDGLEYNTGLDGLRMAGTLIIHHGETIELEGENR